MFLANTNVLATRNLLVYNKTITGNTIDEFCKEMSYFFMKNMAFRNHLQNCQHFNMFGYNLTSPANIYIPDRYIYEQRFCAYNGLTASQTNTLITGIDISDRKLIASHLNVSEPTTHGHYGMANLLIGVRTDEQAIIVIQNF